jgi:hypothetical protein
MRNFIRTKRGCYARATNILWGDRYVQIDDPSGEEKTEEVSNFTLKPNLEKLPAELFDTIISFFALFEKEHHEVQVVLLRNEEDVSQWMVVVPKQKVTSTSVSADLTKLINLISGDIYDGIPESWVYAGTMHLHPDNLGAFWSGTDDASELKNTGAHCTIGNLNKATFDICSSICIGGNRYLISPDQLIADIVRCKHSKTKAVTCVRKRNKPFTPFAKHFVTCQLSGIKLPSNTKTKTTPTSYYDWYLQEYDQSEVEYVLSELETVMYSMNKQEVVSTCERLKKFVETFENLSQYY